MKVLLKYNQKAFCTSTRHRRALAAKVTRTSWEEDGVQNIQVFYCFVIMADNAASLEEKKEFR